MAALRAGREVQVTLEGETLTLAPEDVTVSVQTRADFDVETDGRFVLSLDTQLDDELLAEGLLRELTSRVNALRKKAGLAVEDRIGLRLDAGEDPLLANALAAQRDWIAEETLATELQLGAAPRPEAATAEELDLGGGHVVRAQLWRV